MYWSCDSHARDHRDRTQARASATRLATCILSLLQEWRGFWLHPAFLRKTCVLANPNQNGPREYILFDASQVCLSCSKAGQHAAHRCKSPSQNVLQSVGEYWTHFDFWHGLWCAVKIWFKQIQHRIVCPRASAEKLRYTSYWQVWHYTMNILRKFSWKTSGIRTLFTDQIISREAEDRVAESQVAEGTVAESRVAESRVAESRAFDSRLP